MTTLPSPGTRVFEDSRPDESPLYHLILLDDDDHTYEYVIVLLGRVFGYSREKAFAIACVVDSEGQATVLTGPREEAERKQDEIHAFGADVLLPRCKGSMSAVIEPAC